jgi:hypothetical protein
MCARGDRLYWSCADSTIHGGRVAGGTIDSIQVWRVAGKPSVLAASGRFASAVVEEEWLAAVPLEGASATVLTWQPPGGRALATAAVRDSTAFAGGGGWLWLLRLGADSIAVLDSLAPGLFVQDAAWAGDTLLCAFGPSGLRTIPTAGDHFGDSTATYADGGTYNNLAVCEYAWAGLDFLGRVRIFDRGGALSPISSTEASGSIWAAAGRGSELAILSLEFGVNVLDLFTPVAPYWSTTIRLPGTARVFEYSRLGMLVHADFSGVFALGADSARLVMANPFNALDLDADSGLAAATGLLSGAALFALQTDSLALPASSIPIDGFAAGAEISGHQLYAASSAACNLGFNVYDVTDPAVPVNVTGWSTCAPVRDLEKVPGGLAVALGDSGIWIYETPIADSSAPLAQSAERRTWRQLAWRDGYLYSRAPDGTVARWGWDGVDLTELERGNFAGATSIDASGEYLAVARNVPGIEVWHWPPGKSPALRESVATETAPGRVALAGDTVWLVDRQAVIREVLAPAIGVDDPATTLPRSFTLDAPFPNPFNGGLALRLHLQPGHWRVDVYNLLGRRVGGWQGRVGTACDLQLVWHPEGADGTPLGTGVYLIRAENEGQRQSRKVTFLK